MKEKIKAFCMIAVLVSVTLFAGSAFVNNDESLAGDAKSSGKVQLEIK